MGLFRNLPLKRKLILIYLISTIAILGLVGTIIIVNEIMSARKTFVSDSEGLTEGLAKNSAAALLFADQKGAEETLRVLKAFPDVRYAAVMDKAGTVQAEYRRDRRGGETLRGTGLGDGYGFSFSEAWFSQAVTLDDEQIGSVYLLRDLKRLYGSLYRNIGILAIAVIVSLIIGYYLSLYLQRMVTDPMNRLLEMMKTVSDKREYELRADATGRDEIGDLARGFNDMLQKIEERDAELTAHRQRLAELVQKRTVELVRVNNDLTRELEQRERFENALAESEKRYRAIFENTGNASIIIEDDSTISLANAEFARLSGYDLEEVIGKKSWMDFIHPDFVEQMMEYHALRKMSEKGVPDDYDVKVIDRLGRTREVHLTVGLLPGSHRTIASILDITEWKAMEVQLLQSRKMEAVGQLAAGVAHDFNNILTAIIGYGNMLQMSLAADNPERTYVDSILQAGQRAASLTQGLLAFGRKQVIAPREIDLNDAVRSMEGLLRRMIGEDIHLRCLYQPERTTVLADSGQIGQVLMNLATNARDAMPGGGVLSMETSAVAVERDSGSADAGMKPGRYALLTVSDSGTGIPEEIVERVFEPFFTTKGVGQGTGLGLSIVYGIVTQHSGHVHVRSKPGKGTVFSIYLPLLESTHAAPAEEDVSERTGLDAGTETILLAEDDDMVRRLIGTVLVERGYGVIEARDGEEALRTFEARRDSVDLLLLDVVMPGMNGKAVYDNAEKMKPGVKAIFMSGYTKDIIHRKGLREEGVHFVSKPIIQHELIRKVRELLDS
jgi:PAS domain S-box-containing protein